MRVVWWCGGGGVRVCGMASASEICCGPLSFPTALQQATQKCPHHPHHTQTQHTIMGIVDYNCMVCGNTRCCLSNHLGVHPCDGCQCFEGGTVVMVNGTWYYGHFRGEGVVEVNVQGRWLQAYDKNDEDSDFDPSDPNQVEVDGITCFSCFKRANPGVEIIHENLADKTEFHRRAKEDSLAAPAVRTPKKSSAAAPTPRTPKKSSAAAPTPRTPKKRSAAAPTPRAPKKRSAAAPTPRAPKKRPRPPQRQRSRQRRRIHARGYSSSSSSDTESSSSGSDTESSSSGSDTESSSSGSDTESSSSGSDTESDCARHCGHRRRHR